MNTRRLHRFVGFFPAQIRRGVVQLSARIYLGRARSTLTRNGSVSCFVLHQQASRLEEELEMHHGFHRTPLVPGCFKVLQQGLSKRGRCCSAPSLEGKPQLRLCVAARLAGSRGHAAPDRLKSQAWPSNLTLRVQVPYLIRYFAFRSASAVVARRVPCGLGIFARRYLFTNPASQRRPPPCVREVTRVG